MSLSRDEVERQAIGKLVGWDEYSSRPMINYVHDKLKEIEKLRKQRDELKCIISSTLDILSPTGVLYCQIKREFDRIEADK